MVLIAASCAGGGLQVFALLTTTSRHVDISLLYYILSNILTLLLAAHAGNRIQSEVSELQTFPKDMKFRPCLSLQVRSAGERLLDAVFGGVGPKMDAKVGCQ